ncbi:MAG: hypothetical protein LBC73_03790, partial [Oscillospiraceae bacterium]|nr:hypothetical protein [Oscillospiraceae bacterium]
GLYNVRRINSLNWGILGGVQALSFNENLVSDNITNYRYLLNSSWYDRCIHDENYQPIDDTTDQQADGSTRDGTSYLGEPVTLEEAKRTPGLYIKTNDGFIHVEPRGVSFVRGIESGNASASDFLPLLYDADFEITKIVNTEQLVLIGITDIAIYEPVHTGWTIPVGLILRDEVTYMFGSTLPPKSELLLGRYNALDRVSQPFLEINGENPTNYVHRMIYTGFGNVLGYYHGILSARYNEEFVFGWMWWTDWVEETYIADKRFFTLPVLDSNGIRANYNVAETRDGYFEIIFFTPPVGYYGIGRTAHFGIHGPRTERWDMIVEFVSP